MALLYEAQHVYFQQGSKLSGMEEAPLKVKGRSV